MQNLAAESQMHQHYGGAGARPRTPSTRPPLRRETREVLVGGIGIGGTNPIRVQSMVTTETRDVLATAAQIQQLARAGCEIVRVTTPSIADAQALREIRQELRRRRVSVPLVADVHFTPNAAMTALEYVEKVRINPGNYADKKKFEVREYSDAEYREEIERVADRFRPLVRRAKELGRALRIGTNHGSLSDRIMNRFGDTPLGMVESALEFLDVCEDEGFFDLVFSMKASNPQVAIRAYQLLASKLEERAPGLPSYPLHLGVTEAGEGLDARVKSAIGIGALLDEGLGDTIRVSLTEDPAHEVPVGRDLARRGGRTTRLGANGTEAPAWIPRQSGDGKRRKSKVAGRRAFPIGGAHPVRVELELGRVPAGPELVARVLERALEAAPGRECEGVVLDAMCAEDMDGIARFSDTLRRLGVGVPVVARIPAELVGTQSGVERVIVPVELGTRYDALVDAARWLAEQGQSVEWGLRCEAHEIGVLLGRVERASLEAQCDAVLSLESAPFIQAHRILAQRLEKRGSTTPIVLRHFRSVLATDESAVLDAATDLGTLLCEGLGDAVSLSDSRAYDESLDLAYRILQGARARITQAEFISCPSCGRTQFKLEEVSAKIRARTEHLRDVKIAIMGCIVNGPGEMADADFGYVGSGPGLVNLYVGKELVEHRVPDTEAEDRLVELIRAHGRWVEPSDGAAADELQERAV